MTHILDVESAGASCRCQAVMQESLARYVVLKAAFLTSYQGFQRAFRLSHGV